MIIKIKNKIKIMKPENILKNQLIWFGILTIWSLIAGIYIFVFNKELWFMGVYLVLGFLSQIAVFIQLYQQYITLKEQINLPIQNNEVDWTNEKPDYIN